MNDTVHLQHDKIVLVDEHLQKSEVCTELQEGASGYHLKKLKRFKDLQWPRPLQPNVCINSFRRVMRPHRAEGKSHLLMGQRNVGEELSVIGVSSAAKPDEAMPLKTYIPAVITRKEALERIPKRHEGVSKLHIPQALPTERSYPCIFPDTHIIEPKRRSFYQSEPSKSNQKSSIKLQKEKKKSIAEAIPVPRLILPKSEPIIYEPGSIIPEPGSIIPEPGPIMPEHGPMINEPKLLIPEGQENVVTTPASSEITLTSDFSFGKEPVNVFCVGCNNEVTTEIHPEVGPITYAAFFLTLALGLWGGCCLMPFCTESCQDVKHICPKCQSFLGKYKKPIWPFRKK